MRGKARECMEAWKHTHREMDELLLLVQRISRELEPDSGRGTAAGG